MTGVTKVLSYLWKGEYKRRIVANKKKNPAQVVVAVSFLSRYLNGLYHMSDVI